MYQDPTYDEEYTLDGAGQPLSTVEIVTLTNAGQASRLRAVKTTGPTYDPSVYAAAREYRDGGDPRGMLVMGGQLWRRIVGNRMWSGRFVQIDVPALATAPAPWSDPAAYTRVSAEVAFPLLGPVVQESQAVDSVFTIRLASTYPNHRRFERRLSDQSWVAVDGDSDVLPVGACRVEYRSIDAVGSASAVAVVDVWAPRAESFIRTALPGSTRARASFCVSLPIQ